MSAADRTDILISSRRLCGSPSAEAVANNCTKSIRGSAGVRYTAIVISHPRLSRPIERFTNEQLCGFLTQSVWPDVGVSIGIAVMNADAARELWDAAGEEHFVAA
jgi:hypothetical protein